MNLSALEDFRNSKAKRFGIGLALLALLYIGAVIAFIVAY
jgi:hypothetical protein